MFDLFPRRGTVIDGTGAAGSKDHSERDPREIIVGYSARSRLLVVPFTERVEVVRLISARVATRREHRRHEENRKA